MEILRTKLYRPPPPERLLKRRHLLQQLERGLNLPVTLVTAPAGYGKTMLVSSWLADQTHPACWVSLDAGDNDLYTFLAYLIAAVQSYFPEACAGSASLLSALEPPPLSVLQTRLINELDILPQKIIVVLDDYHQICSPEIHKFIINLVNRMPSSIHLLISTRELPPFPLAVWRTRQHMSEITTRDLRFTNLEADQFLKSVIGNSIPIEMLKVIQDKSEGWIAGLQLATFSLRKSTDPIAFINSFHKYGSENIREFLLDQAFASQPVPIQEFLLKTSILDRFSAPLCNALGLSGENLHSTEDTISLLRRTNLFIVPMDEQEEWFRYHNLFAETLQRRLNNQCEPAVISALHRRAVEWFETHDYIDEAIKHALATGDPLFAVQIVERHIFDALNLEKNATIDRWLCALPPVLVETRPHLMMVRAWIESYRHHNSYGTTMDSLIKAQTLLDSLQDKIDPETRTLMDGYISALWPFSLIELGQFELGADRGKHALKILPDGHFYVRGRALVGWALCMQALGRGNEAIDYLVKERDTHPEVNAYSLAILQSLASLYTMNAKLDDLEQTGSDLCNKAEARGFQILTGWGYFFLGVAAYAGNDLQTARIYFERAANLRYIISKFIVRESMVCLCLTAQALGAPNEVQVVINQLKELEGNRINEYQRSLYARLALSRNDLPAAQRWSLADPTDLPRSLFVWQEIPHFTQARIWVVGGKPENLNKAVTLLNDLYKIAQNTGSRWRVIESLILLACALYQQGKHTSAFERLEEAVKAAQPGRFIRPFIEAGPLAAEMLRQIKSSDTEFVHQILTGFGSDRKGGGFNSLLTQREMDVLQLLDEHLSEREIAARLSVSPDTVKKHCYHIYNKLGVNRRRDAVAAAREAGILK